MNINCYRSLIMERVMEKKTKKTPKPQAHVLMLMTWRNTSKINGVGVQFD